jgi:ribosome-associated heat shock protein Hsp15
VEIEVGDLLVAPLQGGLRTFRVEAIGLRRGPLSEARNLYSELDAGPIA